jgi:hypothetical protein
MKSMDIWSLEEAILKLFKQEQLDDMYFSCEILSTFTKEKIDCFMRNIFFDEPNSHVRNFVLNGFQIEPNKRLSSLSIKDHFSNVKPSNSVLVRILNNIAGVSNQVTGVSNQAAEMDDMLGALSKQVADGFMRISKNLYRTARCCKSRQ